ncbi:hypothetical protein, partial [Burkholderia ambifaria]|uniref:hypothetical protein n=1 Tax=Burkholderia ambifaria TaxID=152480 RepID=UPI001ABA0905
QGRNTGDREHTGSCSTACRLIMLLDCRTPHLTLALRHFLGSFASIIAGSGPGQTTYPTVQICAATSIPLPNKA